MVRGTLLGWHTTAGRGWALCCFFFLFCFLLITPQSEQSKKKKKPINLSLTVLLTFSSFSLCALLHTWVLGDGRWGTKPHYPEKVLSPPSKETQKDHLGAMKQINKSLLLRARWLPLTQQMLRSNVLPKRVLLSDIARTSLSPTGCFPEGEENESWLSEWDGQHTATIRSHLCFPRPHPSGNQSGLHTRLTPFASRTLPSLLWKHGGEVV